MNLSVSLSLDKAELRLPASASHCLRLAGRCPNSDSLVSATGGGRRRCKWLGKLDKNRKPD